MYVEIYIYIVLVYFFHLKRLLLPIRVSITHENFTQIPTNKGRKFESSSVSDDPLLFGAPYLKPNRRGGKSPRH